MRPRGDRRLSDRRRKVVRTGADDHRVPGNQHSERARIAQVGARRLDPERGDGREARRILVGDRERVIAAVVQQLGDGLADLAGAEEDERRHVRVPVTGWLSDTVSSVIGIPVEI